VRVLVTFAVDAEFAPWRKLRDFRKEELIGGGHADKAIAVYRTECEGNFLDIGFTGIGWRGLNLGLQHLLTRKPNVWISSGLAGALRESAQLGDVIAPRAVLMETNSPEPRLDCMNVDQQLHELAVGLGAKDADSLLTTRRVLTKAIEKKTHDAKATLVDMESFWALKEANKLGMRTLVIRAISDRADENLPIDFNRVLSEANQVSIPRILFQLAKTPFELPAMIRFGKQSRRAAESLTDFLEGYVQSLARANSPAVSEVAAQ
jgi:nucleoside phosphorylase